jgi:hypothetical protein
MNSRITANDKKGVVETDVVIFPMDEISSDNGRLSIKDKTLETFTPTNENKDIEINNHNSE